MMRIARAKWAPGPFWMTNFWSAIISTRTALCQGLPFRSREFFKSGMEKDNAPGHNSRHRGARHRASIKRRIAAPGFRARRVEGPLKQRIENCYIGVSVGAQRAAIFQTKDPRGVCRQDFHQALDVDHTLI